MEEALKHYNSLLASGDLLELFPDLKGNWEEDKKIFIIKYEETQGLLNTDLSIDDEDENEYEEFDY